MQVPCYTPPDSGEPLTRRSRLQMCIAILKACRQPRSYTNIYGTANINTSTWKQLKPVLFNAGLLTMFIGRVDRGYYGRKYETTVKGREFLRDYRKLLDCLEGNY